MWLECKNIRQPISLSDIPVVPYARFYNDISQRLVNENIHCANYFGIHSEVGLKFYCLLLDDKNSEVLITSWEYDYYSDDEMPSLTVLHNSMHPFEREITENFGIEFKNNPYNKSLRFAHNRMDKTKTINSYPFYIIEGHSLHQVNVGPIHAGIIEPGVFRFNCNGEKVLHLEVVLGYQHRGVESLIIDTTNRLRQVAISETIAGDSAVSHSVAMCYVLEGFTTYENKQLERERAVAMELERIAMHIADTAALCTDIGYQLGQVACEALRTLVINTTQQWCGNRFGKSLIRPYGSNFPMTIGKATLISDNVKEARRRYKEVCNDLLTTPSVLSRFEDCGVVSCRQMLKIGAVGLASRASGIKRDIRYTHKYGVYKDLLSHIPIVVESGDVMARVLVRYKEVIQSADYIVKLLRDIHTQGVDMPNYNTQLPVNSMSFSLVEGWRGEICHVAITDNDGELISYKIKDPSLHNWYALSLSVRGGDISDFPVCNKSFNLSYCGHDL